jgi:hypothetical protein
VNRVRVSYNFPFVDERCVVSAATPSTVLPFENAVQVIQAACPGCHSAGGPVIAAATDFEFRTTDLEFFYVRCDRCRLVYLKNRPAIEELRRCIGRRGASDESAGATEQAEAVPDVLPARRPDR